MRTDLKILAADNSSVEIGEKSLLLGGRWLEKIAIHPIVQSCLKTFWPNYIHFL